VYSPEGALLGRTPLKLEWPVSSQASTFELRLAGHRRRTKDLVVSSHTSVRVELERLPPPVRPPGPGSSQPWSTGSGDSGLMRPQ
jgi:hypothetical protein